MEYINQEGLNKVLKEQESGEVFMEVAEDNFNTLKYLSLKRESLQSLYRTCLSSNEDLDNIPNVEKSLKEYVDNNVQFNDFKFKLLRSVVGKENYILMKRNNARWEFDFILDCLVVRW